MMTVVVVVVVMRMMRIQSFSHNTNSSKCRTLKRYEFSNRTGIARENRSQHNRISYRKFLRVEIQQTYCRLVYEWERERTSICGVCAGWLVVLVLRRWFRTTNMRLSLTWNEKRRKPNIRTHNTHVQQQHTRFIRAEKRRVREWERTTIITTTPAAACSNWLAGRLAGSCCWWWFCCCCCCENLSRFHLFGTHMFMDADANRNQLFRSSAFHPVRRIQPVWSVTRIHTHTQTRTSTTTIAENLLSQIFSPVTSKALALRFPLLSLIICTFKWCPFTKRLDGKSSSRSTKQYVYVRWLR